MDSIALLTRMVEISSLSGEEATLAAFLVEAIRWRDYPIVQNLVMYIAIIVVFVNFTVDMLYAVLDPRIKYSG